MKTYLVWETDYPEDGSWEIRAKNPSNAKTRYLRVTGADPETELGVDVLTAELRRVRARNEATP